MLKLFIARSIERLWLSIFGLTGAALRSIEWALFLSPVAFPVAVVTVILIAVAVVMFVVSIAFRDVLGIIIYDFAKVSEDIVNVIISIIDWVMRLFHKGGRPSKQHYAESIEFMKNKHMCDPYDSYSATILYTIRARTSHYVCPVVRYMYGTPSGVLLHLMMDWFTFDPMPEGANCIEPKSAEYCVGFIENWRFWVVFAALIPALFLGIISIPLIEQCLLIAYRALVVAVDVLYYFSRALMFIFHPHLRRDSLPK